MTYRQYEWTAFSEADLLGAGSGNGHSLGHGDTFTMPGSATVNISTWDNDSKLSGDNWKNEKSNDKSGQQATVDGENLGARLYAESYHVLHGSDGRTYYLIEIEVEGYNAPGIGDDYFSFYGAVPPAGVELSVGGQYNVKGSWVHYDCLTAGHIAPANTPPEFTNLPDDGIICIDENTTFVIDANASDADGDSLTYEIVGGRDAAFFEIDQDTGALTFIGAPDFENPESGGNSNTYDVTIKVFDDKGGSDTKALWVKVKDVDENPTGQECIVIEAEDMHEWGFKTVHGANASGGEFIKLKNEGGQGDISTTFNGESGEYDLTFFAQDESDGQSTITVKVNGHVVDTIKLDRDSDGHGNDDGNFSEFTIDNIQLNTGDTLSFWVDGDHGEFVRFDKIELCKDGEPCPDGFTLQDFSGVSKGTVVGSQFDGFTVTAQRNGDAATSENDAMIFDSSNPTGGDNDLGFANLGNIIIISEDNDSSDPDDNAGGGSITFDFDNPSDVHDIKLLDIEETGGTIDLFDEDGNLIKSVAIPAPGDNSIQTILLDAVGVDSMVINLVGSGAVDDLCFNPGEEPLGSLSGRYFFDADRNGLDDDAANAIAGIEVELLDENGVGTGITTTTDADGNYSFGNLVAGDYGVKFTDPDTTRELTTQNVDGDVSDDIDSDASDVGGGMSEITGITVVAGQNTPDNDAGVVELLGSLSGRYFCDDDRDGTELNGSGFDVGVAGFTVVLLDAAGAPVLDAAGNQVTTTTGSDGSYSFTGLIPGDYGVQFVGTPPMKQFIAPNQGSDDAVDSDAIADGAGNASIQGITVSAGQDTPDNDAGVVDLPGSLSGRYFFDADRDGLDNDGANAIAGIEVELLDENGVGTGITTTTDADGNYSFGNLVAGTYGVKFTDPATDRELTTQNVDGDLSDDIDSDAADVGGGMSEITGITVVAGQNTPDNDAGVVELLGSLSGRYFCDDDGDGTELNGAGLDVGVAGFTVVLLDAAGAPVLDAAGNQVTTTTGSDGSYSFTGLIPGDYGVQFVGTPPMKQFIAPNQGGDDSVDSDAISDGAGNASIQGITVSAGQDTPDNDAGVDDPGTASVGDFVFFDADRDGLQTPGEVGVGGVGVTLTGAGSDGVFGTADDIEQTTVTDDDGAYLFDNLDAGDYKITFDAATTGGLLFTTQGDEPSDDNGLDSDANGVTGMSDVFTLDIGEAERDIDAGLVDPLTGRIGDKVFIDADADGQQDAGEVGVDDVEVTLFNAAGIAIATTMTTNGGMYLFDGLAAGDYTVGFAEVDMFDFTTPDQGDDVTDSDADQTTGLTGVITLGVGGEDLTIDAGLVAENNDPDPMNDVGVTCADDLLTVDVLANDSDADGDTLTITQVDGQAITEGGSVTTAAGTIVTLSGGQLVFDGEAAYAALDINEEALENISYTVDDGQGGSADANVAVTFKGDANTLESFFGSFPAAGTYELDYAVDEGVPFPEYAFDLRFLNTGDARLDGVLFEEAYCLDFATAVDTLGVNTGDFFGAQSAEALAAFDANTVSNANGLAGSENLDLINWVVAQNFEDQGFSGWEVQIAIWELADDFDATETNFTLFENSDLAGVQQIVDAALALAGASDAGVDSFVPTTEGTVGLIVNPGTSDPTNVQPFIVGLDFETFDCIC